MAETIYSATSTAWGGREGWVSSDDGRVNLNLSIPKSMGGDDGPGTNPEQLFATGYAACFHSALRAVARGHKLDVSDSAVSVTVRLVGDIAAGDIALAASIEAEIPGVDPEVAQTLLAETHRLCPYSRATQGNIQTDLALASS